VLHLYKPPQTDAPGGPRGQGRNRTSVPSVRRRRQEGDCETRVCVVVGGGGIGNRSVKDARAAVVKLHGATKFKGKSSGALWARQLGGEGALLKRWKLIVRNLSFKVTSLSPDRVNVL
jgi:hypothetical protein